MSYTTKSGNSSQIEDTETIKLTKIEYLAILRRIFKIKKSSEGKSFPDLLPVLLMDMSQMIHIIQQRKEGKSLDWEDLTTIREDLELLGQLFDLEKHMEGK